MQLLCDNQTTIFTLKIVKLVLGASVSIYTTILFCHSIGGNLVINHNPSSEMVTDPFTKTLTRDYFIRHVQQFGTKERLVYPREASWVHHPSWGCLVIWALSYPQDWYVLIERQSHTNTLLFGLSRVWFFWWDPRPKSINQEFIHLSIPFVNYLLKIRNCPRRLSGFLTIVYIFSSTKRLRHTFGEIF